MEEATEIEKEEGRESRGEKNKIKNTHTSSLSI